MTRFFEFVLRDHVKLTQVTKRRRKIGMKDTTRDWNFISNSSRFLAPCFVHVIPDSIPTTFKIRSTLHSIPPIVEFTSLAIRPSFFYLKADALTTRTNLAPTDNTQCPANYHVPPETQIFHSQAINHNLKPDSTYNTTKKDPELSWSGEI